MMSYPSLVAPHQVSVGVGGCYGHEALWREVDCAVNPTLGTELWGQSPGDLSGGCQQGWELLCVHGSWQNPLTAVFAGNRTDLTLPRDCWAPRGLAQLNKDFFCQPVPHGCNSVLTLILHLREASHLTLRAV